MLNNLVDDVLQSRKANARKIRASGALVAEQERLHQKCFYDMPAHHARVQVWLRRMDPYIVA